MNIAHQFYLAVMTAFMKHNEQAAITCPIQDLTKPIPTWSFTPRMACSNDQVDGSRKAARLNMPLKSQCTYTYTCPFDSPNMYRQTTMTCGLNGKWTGEMPDCTDTDELADAIMDVFDHVAPEEEPEATAQTSVETSTQAEISAATPEDRSVQTSTVKKNKSNSRRKQLKRLCDSQKMCSKLRSTTDCPKIVPQNIMNSANKKFSKKLYEIFTGLCYYCFNNYCSQSVTLL